MEVGAIADILENVLPLDEGRHADPRSAVPAHVCQESITAAGLPLRSGHAVTPDTACCDLALQQQRGAVVRAAGAESWRSRADLFPVSSGDFRNLIQPPGDGFARRKIPS